MTTITRAARPGLWPFIGWAAAGAALCLAAFSILSIGIFVLPMAVAGLAALISWRGTRNSSAAGLLCGLGAVPVYIAYLNRGGPGTVCGAVASGGQVCTAEWNPWPFLAAGVVLIAAGAALFWRLRGRTRAS